MRRLAYYPLLRRSALAPHWGALLALALFLVAGLAVLDDYGVTTDEFVNALRAERNYAFLIGEADDFASEKFEFRLYGPAFDMALLFVERAFGLEDVRSAHLSRHLLLHLCFLVGGLFAYLLARRLFGNRLPAVGAMLLFLLHPRLYAHSFFNTKDISFLALFTIALFLTHRAFKRDAIPVFVLLGVAVGALVNLRIMGLVLLAAIPSMRALDFALAADWAERKRVLLTTGAFALAAALTFYALQPYLWADPVGRAVEWWTTLSQHPIARLELFRGALISNEDFSVEYILRWFSITSPPFALLLGVVGAAALLAAAVKAPRKALRSERLRFGALLIGCLAAPVLAVGALGANIYDGWRHLYFLWAPFSLLAAFGIMLLADAARRPRMRAAVYGAAGAGLAATLVSMALIHPNQQVAFNFLVDRVAPEHLRAQYLLDIWGHPARQALVWLLDEHPDAGFGVNAFNRRIEENTRILPASSRERITLAPGEDAFAIRLAERMRDDLILHRVKVYGNTIAAVERPNGWRRLYEAAVQQEPEIDSVFGFHRVGKELILIKEPCSAPYLTNQWLILRPTAGDGEASRPSAREEALGLWRFPIGSYGALFDGKCVASLSLPRRPLTDFEVIWQPMLLDEREARESARRARDEGRLLARSAYDVYLANGELAYLRDSCDPAETERPFHLNVFPQSVSDLPDDRWELGFESFRFEFHRAGAFVDGGCAAFFPLPDYPIAGIRTGQSPEGDGDLWSAKFSADPERRWAESIAGVSGEPLARGAFDVHLADGALAYVKQPCQQEDTEARFYLHVAPERASDLPEGRGGYGFDNLDFDFFLNGALFEGKCAARIPLPDYPVAGVRTGQSMEDGGDLWRAEFSTDPERRWAESIAGVSGKPLARGAFDVHLTDEALVYVKQPCEPRDTEARFFLHVTPERVSDLPDEREQHGFDNLDFDFFLNGALFEGKCAARVPLPGYAIAEVRTGQYASGGDLWSVDAAMRNGSPAPNPP